MSGPFPTKQPRYWFRKPYADFVARMRVPAGFLLLVAFAWLSRPSRVSLLVGLPLSMLGLWLRAWAAGHLAKDRQLATTGPYAYLRNPLYVGTLIVAAGIVIAARDMLLGVIFLFVFLLAYLPAIELEEQHLRSLFPAYDFYAARVNRLFPLSKWTGNHARFSWLFYINNKEYDALLGFALAVAWLLFKLWWPWRLH
ncbi:MAG: isoprenylcysteine carboxylmethyltransferase family protein [Acidobacteriaceae bacterium]|nr:isoprenylcysteine carboxylmethyltransferase family protein [Acidobacteriaceae bacterium]MBV9781460.1 isoprenylcysteine carboxylmethyltransferase family protein [Acidobacteriaceae bacterium]